MPGEIPNPTRAELEALQLDRLRETLTSAHEHVPHYRRAFTEAGVTPDDLHTIADLVRFPFTAKADLREVWMAPDRATAAVAIATFAEKYGAKYEKAVTCLTKDRNALLTFYDFPAEHWDHLRTSNPIESVFATVRHRTVRTKGALSQDTARLMVFKLVMAAAKTWRRLKGENQLPKLIRGATFRDGVEVTDTPAQTAA